MEAIKQIPIIVILLAIAGVVLAASVLILSNWQDTQIVTGTETNETVTADNGTSVALTYTTDVACSSAVARAAGGTLTLLTLDTNYSCSDAGFMLLTATYDGNSTNVTYTYTTEDYVYNASSDSLLGLTSVAEQQTTIAIIAVMVIIIALITGVFVYFRFR